MLRLGKTARREQNLQKTQMKCQPDNRCAHPSQGRGSPVAEGRDELIRSLAAPRSLLGNITIESLAFLALLALYVEFPAIQDLIYTKLCLDLLASHPNLTRPLQSSEAQPAAGTLAREGRIQPASSENPTTLPIASLQLHKPTELELCNRLNKSAIPLELRKELLDSDSLFWLQYQILICSLCALTSPYWGGLSDRLGRLLPLSMPLAASLLSNLISLALGLLIGLDAHRLLSIHWLYLGAGLVGLSGGQAVLMMAVFSLLSDSTSSEERSKRVTILESVIYVSHSFGFLLNKWVMSLGLAASGRPWANRHAVAFAACLLLNSACLLLAATKLRRQRFHRLLNNFEREQQEAVAASELPAGSRPERLAESLAGCERPRELTSTSPDDPSERPARRLGLLGAIATLSYYSQTFAAATRARESRPVVLMLLLAAFLSALSLATLMSLLFVYLRMEPFSWTTSQYSLWNSLASITRGGALVALTICMKFASGWNVPDPLVAALGFVSKASGLLMIGLAQSSALINWSLLAFALSEYTMPPIRSLLSKLVPGDELGKIYSCLGSLQSICFIAGNLVFYLAFTKLALHDFFRLSFVVVAAFEFGAVILMLIIYNSLRRRMLAI